MTFKKNTKTVVEIIGGVNGAEDLTVAELTKMVSETEVFLEKLTGHRVSIEQMG